MASYKDHLLIIDEMSAAFASKLADKTQKKADRIGNILPKVTELASQPQNIDNPYAQKHVTKLANTYSKAKRVSDKLAQYAKNKL